MTFALESVCMARLCINGKTSCSIFLKSLVSETIPEWKAGKEKNLWRRITYMSCHKKCEKTVVILNEDSYLLFFTLLHSAFILALC